MKLPRSHLKSFSSQRVRKLLKQRKSKSKNAIHRKILRVDGFIAFFSFFSEGGEKKSTLFESIGNRSSASQQGGTL